MSTWPKKSQGEDPDHQMVGIGGHGGAGGDVEVAAEQAGEDLAESHIGRAQGTAGEVAGAEEAVGHESAEQESCDDHIGQRCAQQARAAGDLEPGE
jgi:hypothetical protein